jgi:hypothetical protein
MGKRSGRAAYLYFKQDRDHEKLGTHGLSWERIAQIVRAILLASATVTTFGGTTP